MMRNVLSIYVWMAVFAAAVLPSPLVLGQDTRAQENRKARLEKEIRKINSQLSATMEKSSSALSDLRLLGKKISLREELVQESDREIASLDREIAAKQDTVQALQARLDTLSAFYRRLVVNSYKNRDSRVWYMYIFGSEDLSQAMRRAVYLRGFSREMNSQGEKVKRSRAELEEAVEELSAMKESAEKLRQARRAEVDALRGERSQSEALVAKLNKEKDKYQRQLDEKRRQVEALNREIAEIIRKAVKKSSGGTSGKPGAKGGKSTSSAVDTKLAKEFASNKGKLPWPVDGTVVESFGEHNHPVYKNVKLPFNNGVNVAVAKGAEVKAVFDGTVAQIVVMPGYNQCVLVQHGSYFTFYCKLGSVSVKAGDKVRTGQVLGKVDTIGGETQLHFQLWSGRNPQNPENWLK